MRGSHAATTSGTSAAVAPLSGAARPPVVPARAHKSGCASRTPFRSQRAARDQKTALAGGRTLPAPLRAVPDKADGVKTIGVLGGGQLGLMMAEAAVRRSEGLERFGFLVGDLLFVR